MLQRKAANRDLTNGVLVLAVADYLSDLDERMR